MAYLDYILRVAVVILIYAVLANKHQNAIHRDNVIGIKIRVVRNLICKYCQRVGFVLNLKAGSAVADKQQVAVGPQSVRIKHRV